MTGQDIKDFLESDLLDGDTRADDQFLNYANNALRLLEALRPWNFLKVEDSSQTASSGEDFDTRYNLPTRYMYTRKMTLGESDFPVDEISFEEARRRRRVTGFFFVDHAQSKFGLTGTRGQNETIYHMYIQAGADLALDTSPVFPDRYHKVLGFAVAALYRTGVDYDDFNKLIGEFNRAEAITLLQAMEMWDDKINENAMEGEMRGDTRDLDSHPDVVGELE